MKLELRIPAPADQKTAAAGRELLAELTAGATLETREIAADQHRRAIDPLALGALVLAVPGALVALADLKDRLSNLSTRRELKKRIEPAPTRARDQRPSPTLTIGEKIYDLGRVSTDTILDALRRASISASKSLGGH